MVPYECLGSTSLISSFTLNFRQEKHLLYTITGNNLTETAGVQNAKIKDH